MDLYDVRCLASEVDDIQGLILNDLGNDSACNFSFGVARKSVQTEKISDQRLTLVPFNRPPPRPIPGRWFYSSASLAGVVRVDVGQLCEAGVDHCIGLVLHYQDGHRETLGQWRPDFPSSIIAPADFLIFYLGKTKNNKRTVQTVRTSKSCLSAERLGGRKVVQVPLAATLVWWFQSDETRLRVI